MRTIPFGGPGRRSGIVPLALLIVGFLSVAAADAGATLRVESHNDPAGDETPITYRLDNPAWTRSPIEFALRGGETTSFGPQPGTYTVQAFPPSGWKVNDIRCIGPDPAEFVIDVPHGLVTLTHRQGAEQTCAFTNGKVNASGPPSSGVSPSPPPAELPKVKLPDEVALLGVFPGKGSVAVKLRLIKQSVISVQLRHGVRVRARKRVVRKAGTRVVRVSLRSETRRRFRERGRRRVPFTVRIRVAERGGTTKVFWYGVIIPV
jgi:hypothetical protein